MKLLLAVGIGLLVAALGGTLYWRSGHRVPSQARRGTSEGGTVLTVNGLREGTDRVGEDVEVEGVVGGTSAARRLFGLIDRSEVEECGRLDCAEFLLPVKWEGRMPRLGETVTVKGRLEKTAEGLVLLGGEVRPE